MVYCGKPSKGCQMCRARRIKCDETKPTCNQCAKARRQCPGYRDEFDIVLRDENQAAERRALKASVRSGSRRRATAGGPSSSSSSSRSIGEGHLPSPSPTISASSSSPTSTTSPASTASTTSTTTDSFHAALIPAIQVPAEDLATCHFVSNFVLVPRVGSTRGFMDFLIPLMKPGGGMVEKHLQHAFNACALACWGNRGGNGGGRRDCQGRAFSEYNEALRTTQVALKDPVACTGDAVLAAVLLLGMFENIMATKQGMPAWKSHIEGAMHIVRARGEKQLQTKIGLQLFVAVRTQVIIHTLSSAIPPEMGVDWWLNAFIDPTAAACQRLNLSAAQLRAEVTKAMAATAHAPHSTETIRALGRRAQALDADIAAWMASLPPLWKFKTVCWRDHPGSHVPLSQVDVFPGRVDVYTDFWIASVWNLARVTRLILMSLAVRCAARACAPLDYRTTPEYAAASTTCVETIADILASVPFHLGWHSMRRDLFDTEGGMPSGFACGEEDSLKGLAGYFLTWPLAMVMTQDYATDAQRTYIQGRLKHIGDELGVRYSHVLAQLQLRVPSMFIRRDGMFTQANPVMTQEHEKFVAMARQAPPLSAGYAVNPILQREAMQLEQLEQQRTALLRKAAGERTEDQVRLVAKKWLAL